MALPESNVSVLLYEVNHIHTSIHMQCPCSVHHPV